MDLDIRPYIYLAKIRLLMQLAYRAEVVASLGLNMIPLATMAFLWQSAFKDQHQNIGGVDSTQMVTYSILAVSLKDIFYFRTQDAILEAVRSGSIILELLRPINLFLRYLADDIAGSLVNGANKFIPLVLISMWLIQPPQPASLSSAVLFCASASLSYFILWLLSALCGLLSFWFVEIGNLGMVKDAVVRILSGSIIPIWFFPQQVQNISSFLPFQYTYQTPLGIFIGKIPIKQGLQEIGTQAMWVAILGTVVAISWNRARKHLLIQGG